MTGVLRRHLERRFLTSTQKSDLVSFHHGWRGFLFLQSTLLNLSYWCGRAVPLPRKAHRVSTPPLMRKLAGCFVFGRLGAMFSLSAFGELTCVPKTRHLVCFFVFTGGVFVFKAVFSRATSASHHRERTHLRPL